MRKYAYIRGLVIAAAVACLTPILNVDACTGIKLKAKDGSFVTGRTLEFGVPVDISAAVIPAGYEFVGSTPQGPGLKYTAKHAVVGAIAFGNPAIMDGLNAAGLAVGTFYFPGFAEYATVTAENQSKALSPVEFANWVVTQFATVEEVKAALSSVVIAPTVTKGWGSTVAPFHYIVYDKTGKGMVIEPIGGKLVTHDNPIGTFTNSPNFDWHMTNLRNFINLSTLNAKPITYDGVVFSSFGQGSGMVGVPGDFTPPSRFVRAAIYSATAVPSENVGEAVFQAFHILNQFDIPKGVARDVDGGKTYYDMTLMTCIKDPQSLRYYFKTYEDQSIKVIDLTKFDQNAKAIKQLKVGGGNGVADISGDLK